MSFRNDIRLLISSVDNAIEETLRRSRVIELKGNIKFNFKTDTFTLNMPEHYKYIDGGRKAGSKMPPINTIIRWIRKKNIRVPSKMKVESLAYAIAKSISHKGIKAKPFIERLNKVIEELVVEYINKQIEEEFKKIKNIK